MTITLPAYTPNSWEIKLPDYPVISNDFRSASFPDLLGSLPSDSRWKLSFQNKTSAEALALLLPWRATGGGVWPLDQLPDALAGGVNNTAFKKRLTGATWRIEKEPTKTSVKNGRFDITLELISELTFEPPTSQSWSGTITFTTQAGVASADYEPVPNSTANSRPLQMPASGGSLSFFRNFIYTDITSADTSVSNWIPVGQYKSGVALPPNRQRFDYKFGTATSGSTGDWSWDDNLTLVFGSFYIEGDYDFCGAANTVAEISVANTGHAQFDGISGGTTGTGSGITNKNYLDSYTYNIVFGASGRTGTLQFSANTIVADGGIIAESGGTITIIVNPP